MLLAHPAPVETRPLCLQERDMESLASGWVRIQVEACAVCRTDLHIAEGELPPHRSPVILGHQIAGRVVESTVAARPVGMQVGISWLGGTDGACPYCARGRENLCDRPVFTGYDVDGGYAEFAAARADFTLPLPRSMTALQAAPLLCAGIIGFRALRVAGVERGERVGLFGFGASAHLAMQVLRHWECEVFVATRGARHKMLAESLGASWVGDALDEPPERLDRAVTFAPSGEVVVAALASLRKGGVVAINAIHLDRMPSFDYDRLLWGERQIRSVANMTRADARDFLDLAAQIPVRANVEAFRLEEANEALQALKNDAIEGSAVLVPAQPSRPAQS
jgi:propanol-preferring alcohol dehydrogenase